MTHNFSTIVNDVELKKTNFVINGTLYKNLQHISFKNFFEQTNK